MSAVAAPRLGPGQGASAPWPADLGRRTLVMAVLNVTPDSFSDGGLFADPEAAVARGVALAAEGADIVDIGGESTRPGHLPVDPQLEQARILPVISALAARIAVPISVDTSRAATARAATAAGARIVNDVWGFQRDPDLAAVAAHAGVAVVLMHNRDRPDPALDVMDEMRRFFERSMSLARAAGLPDGAIALDPGIGFGKTPDQQLEALRRLPELCALGFPVLVGASRKSILGRIAERDSAPRDRLGPSVAAHVLAATLGAAMVRVHDVAAHREALRVVDAVTRRVAP